MFDKDYVLSLDRYKDCTILDTPVKFCELFKNEDIPYVQEHDVTCYDWGIVGFSGVWSWINGECKPLDGDSYSADILVYGYRWFEKEGSRYLDILVCID